MIFCARTSFTLKYPLQTLRKTNFVMKNVGIIYFSRKNLPERHNHWRKKIYEECKIQNHIYLHFYQTFPFNRLLHWSRHRRMCWHLQCRLPVGQKYHWGRLHRIMGIHCILRRVSRNNRCAPWRMASSVRMHFRDSADREWGEPWETSAKTLPFGRQWGR